jgi:hypothetical protein
MVKKIPSGYGDQARERKIPRVPKLFGDGYDESPVWQIESLDLAGPFGWGNVDRNLLLNEILPKFKSFESMKWREILGPNSHGIRIADISREAQRRLEELKILDIDELVSLRLAGRIRVWGIKIHKTLRVLWWDPEHQVYPVPKRHR